LRGWTGSYLALLMDYSDKAESKRQAKDALQSLREAERFLEEITRFGAEIQLTRQEFDALVAELRAMRKELLGWQVLAVSLLENEFVPVRVFKPWASYSQIHIWSKLPADQSPIETRLLNKKSCCRPSDFFAALKRHGRARG